MKKISEWIQKYGWVLFILVVVVWISYIFIMNMIYKSDADLNKAGTFGDMFGALNTLFTGLAFVGVVISLFQQNRALDQQNKALEQQNISLEKQQQALDQQNISLIKQEEQLDIYKKELKDNINFVQEQIAHMRLQRIETTLFNLISTHNESLRHISSKKTQYVNLTGIELLEKIFISLLLDKHIQTYSDLKKLEAYDKYNHVSNDSMALNVFKYMLHYIHNLEGMDQPQKQKFMDLLYSQMPISLLSFYVIQLRDDKNYLDIIDSYIMWWD